MCSPDFFGAVFIQGGSSAMTDIMLVDDEVLALEYLKNMVDWERNGYHVVGCATSGKKALELFDRTHPQIVISDIRMPGTDGLELTRQIKEKDKETVVILLSAYRDFDYAQKGIRYGVSNYLLKHELSSELILKELEEVKEKLERAGNRITDPPFIISGVTVVIRIGINPVFFFCILLQFPLLQLLFQIVRIHGTVTASEKASVCHLQNGPLQISTQIVIKHQPFCHLVILALPAEFIPFDVLFQKVLQLLIHQNTLCKPAVILRLKCNLAANLHQTVFFFFKSLFSHHLIKI